MLAGAYRQSLAEILAVSVGKLMVVEYDVSTSGILRAAKGSVNH